MTLLNYMIRYRTESLESADNTAVMKLQGGAETVLIVEDEESILKLSKEMLEMLGYKVLAVNETDQALRLAKEYDGNIDLLLTDVIMPGMNGKELSERIIAFKPGLKRLYMSGYTADVIASQGILEEGVQFISKPFSFKDLAAKVRETLG
jgi:two-component system cell cycle sensor histidine kinase/response regulator CckA